MSSENAEIDATRHVERTVNGYVERDPDVASALTPFVQAIADFETSVRAIAANRELTPAGRAKQVEIIEPKVRGRLNELAAGQAEIESAIVRLEGEALQLRPTPDGRFVTVRSDRDRTADERAAEAFVWQKVSAMPAVEAERIYEAAVVKGDYELSEQIERLPRSFSPIGDRIREAARQIKIERTPHAATIAQLRSRFVARKHVAEMATRFVGELSARHKG